MIDTVRNISTHLAVIVFDISSQPGDAGHPPRPGRPRLSLDATGKCNNNKCSAHILYAFQEGRENVPNELTFSQVRGQGKTGLNFEEAYNVSEHCYHIFRSLTINIFVF